MLREIALQTTNEDRRAILQIASALGLCFIINWPYRDVEVEILSSPDDAMKLDPDVFFLVKAEWIFGPLIFNEIISGYRKGTYAIQPRVNFCCIELFAPQIVEGDALQRLKSASIVLRDRPISGETYVEAPPVISARECYKSFLKTLSEIFQPVRIGEEVVRISNSTRIKLAQGQLLPAFDYQDRFFQLES